METTSYLTLRVGRQLYGIPINVVVEVLQMVALEELPASPSYILGLLTLRNIVMPVVDLRQRFQTDDVSLSLKTPLIAMKYDDKHFAFVADVVDSVVDIKPIGWQEQASDPYVSHSVTLANKLVLILDLDALIPD